MKLLVIGDCSIDLNMHIALNSSVHDKTVEQNNKGHPVICFYHGSKIPVESFETNVAGNSVNVSVGTKLLGIESGIYTETGDDGNAQRIKSELVEKGINIDFFSQNKNNPADVHAVIISGGERTIFSYHGPRKYTVKDWGDIDFIYYTSMGKGFEKFQEQLLEYLSSHKKTVLAFNPGTRHLRTGMDSFKDILEHTDILFLNKEETEMLTGRFEDESEGHKKLQSLGPKLTVITNGEEGASAYDGKSLVSQKAYSDERPLTDKTGAGDAFTSGFLSAIMYGKTLEDALLWGVVNAGSVVKETGSTKGLLSKENLEKIIRNM